MTIKEKALALTAPVTARSGRYQPSDGSSPSSTACDVDGRSGCTLNLDRSHDGQSSHGHTLNRHHRPRGETVCLRAG